MKPLLYIHVGFPKTGSSTIQKFFCSHKSELEKAGICYPEPRVGIMLGGIAHKGHCSMSKADFPFRHDIISWKEYKKLYINEILSAKCKINVLSAEALAYDTPEDLSEFCKYFKIKIICFFRNIFDFLMSGNKQIFKEGLRQDLFTYCMYMNSHILANIERYINFFGAENCIFLDFDKIRNNGNIIDMFLNAIHADFAYSPQHIENDNITPADAANMFFYQCSFLPFNFADWEVLKTEILGMDLSEWRDFRCTLLPQWVFELDDEARRAIRRQGELLREPDWYDKTLARGRELAVIPNHDLPPKIQHDIFNRLSETARAILARHWPRVARAKPAEPLLPSMEHMAQEPFELLSGLHQRYAIELGTAFRLQQQLTQEQERERERHRMAAVPVGAGSVVSQLSCCLAPLFSASARQAHVIRRSGLFDFSWYLENNADVARAGFDPVLHYVRYGAREGRDPAPWFPSRSYWRANPDVFEDGMNPFYHYIRYGRTEGRQLA